MKLTVIGGGGFRVPQIFQALSAPDAGIRLDELCLYDASAERLDVVRAILDQAAPQLARPPKVHSTTDLAEALGGADFVFSAIRPGGTKGRIRDEHTALDLGVLGQETVGPGGLAYALRTVPVALDLAEQVRRIAPQAWVINFTNPAGIITEAMRSVLGNRVVSICDTPIGLVRRAAVAAGRSSADVTFDYVGLNHLGWLRTLEVDGADVLPEILASDALLDGIEEARLLGFDWIRALGAIPNEYLFYYYLHREALAKLTSGEPTRGEYLDAQQSAFYRNAGLEPERAYELWDATRHERESTYMVESRDEDEERRAEDVSGGGYQEVALDLMTGLATGAASTMILGVGNDSLPDGLLVPELPANGVIEVPCTVDTEGVHPQRIAPVRGEMLGMMATVKSCEQLVIRSVTEGSRELAWRALAGHPMVDSIHVAKNLLENYLSTMPEVDELLR